MFQLNKRDLPHPSDLGWAKEHLRASRAAYVESVATRGTGVREVLHALLALAG